MSPRYPKPGEDEKKRPPATAPQTATCFVARMNIENRGRRFLEEKGADVARPQTKRPIGFRRLRQQRRCCGRGNWQPHRCLPEEFRQSPSPGPSSLRRKLRDCRLPPFRPCPPHLF